jgi:transposase
MASEFAGHPPESQARETPRHQNRNWFMPRKRVSMRHVREILRLHSLNLSSRQIGISCRISKTTVSNTIKRAQAAGITWPIPEHLDDLTLEQNVFCKEEPAHALDPNEPTETRTGQVDWSKVSLELKRKGVTRRLLWHEYHARGEFKFVYSTFTTQYKAWQSNQRVSMRQIHKAGEKVFVDYAGMTIAITNQETGEITPAQVFVATLGASNYTFCEATRTQAVEDWLGSHKRMLEYFAGVPEIVVPDNLKSGVKSPSYYEPEINRAYTEFAEHYGLAVIPARVRKPKDKAKVEVHVQIVEREILAPLRNRTFFSLIEANTAIRELLEVLNARPFQKLEGSRKSMLETLDKPELKALPAEAFQISKWRKAKINIDYHLEIDGHYYSVPYKFVRENVDVRLTRNTLEVFHTGKRIASHARVADLPKYRGRHSTITEHMPKAHQKHSEWTPQRLVNWANQTGPCTAKVVQTILETRTHPEQGYRSCLGLLRLGKSYGADRLEAACKRADHLRAYSFKSVQSILQNNLDLKPMQLEENQREMQFVHGNLRGAAYYKTETLVSDMLPDTISDSQTIENEKRN